MKKNSFISVISEEKKEENRGSIEIQVVCFTNKIRRLPIYNCTKKIIYLSEGYEKLWENVNDCWLICQRKMEYVIMN